MRVFCACIFLYCSSRSSLSPCPYCFFFPIHAGLIVYSWEHYIWMVSCHLSSFSSACLLRIMAYAHVSYHFTEKLGVLGQHARITCVCLFVGFFLTPQGGHPSFFNYAKQAGKLLFTVKSGIVPFSISLNYAPNSLEMCI